MTMSPQFICAVSIAAFTAIAGFAALTPGALASSHGQTPEFKAVTGLEDFKAHFIDTKIMDPKDSANFFIIKDDGIITGTWYGKALKGKWYWEGGFFCRTLSAPRPAPEDCQQWSRADGKARLIRKRGTGKTTIYARAR